jgi:hypothetical protein
MGAARLRIASFPTVTTGTHGHEWVPPATPKPSPYKITTSYVNRYDLLDAVADGLEPDSSNDEKIPRMTWWAHRGTKEWVQYEFGSRKISRTAVYWYDDGNDGECRVPVSWKVLYKRGDSWVPVETSEKFRTGRDGWNTTAFKEIETTAVRLEVQLQEGFSGGILEWKVE